MKKLLNTEIAELKVTKLSGISVHLSSIFLLPFFFSSSETPTQGFAYGQIRFGGVGHQRTEKHSK